ncbi:MAG: phosphoribosylformylglycinamidine synthase [Clostridia bacterium]|nr:phosphoribosylformylglycinamidine synthase [Clostridia bacterium]
MVYRIYCEKKKGLDNEARALLGEAKSLLGVKNLESVRVLNRYDVENITEEIFAKSKRTVFSEPQLDNIYDTLPETDGIVFAVEYLPGQFDQRADSASQCIQLMSQANRPTVKSAKVYILNGNITDDDVDAIKKYVINPVDSREATLDTYKTLEAELVVPEPVKVVDGFIKMTDDELADFINKNGLAMDIDDIKFCREYFTSEHRDPTITEIKMIDTYWSDHCRHTTFLTTIDEASFEDDFVSDAYDRYTKVRAELKRTKPVNLMDIATMAVRYLKSTGDLAKLDESEEINACTVKIDVDVEGKKEKWLLLFKNETHNHPTEIEPFGGAATCIGGAIRDPLSGRAYVYQAMRVTGAADPLKPISETIPGKLPQRKIVTTAANGYSSYGNQIGLATGIVDELYHDGYAAKRLEIGAVVGAAPQENVRREVPSPGDVVILLGGRTGRDGCGGATGSSKSHSTESLENCGAEVQKGNAPEERKLQRLFRNKEASLLIKRCNDFGAGGVSVAIGELADGLKINLNAVPKKYDGLDGTELAISESQERMAVVVEPKDVDKFISLASSENLEATIVAQVTEEPRLVMNHDGRQIVDLSREFLNSNGAEKHITITVEKAQDFAKKVDGSFSDNIKALAGDLNVCSKKGLSERFDSTIGAGSVYMPFGGKYQQTPAQAMAAKIPLETKETDTCSVMSWGYNPYIMEKSPYHGAYLAVVESIAKLVSTGAPLDDCYLTFQEYFKKPLRDPKRWGQPMGALLGAFDAQLDFAKASIGGKDSMSGSFEDIDVPPTLVSFAITVADAKKLISPEFKKAGSKVVLVKPELTKLGLPEKESQKKIFALVNKLAEDGSVVSAYTPGFGGIAEAVMKMSFGNRIGFKFADGISKEEIFGYNYGAFVLETTKDIEGAIVLGETTEEYALSFGSEKVCLCDIEKIYCDKLEPVFPVKAKAEEPKVETFSFPCEKRVAPSIKVARPKVLIPVFPGTNCEFDTAKRLLKAGADPEIMVINNLTQAGVAQSVEKFASLVDKSQIIFIPGGFSGGDEPDGSGKFITAFLRNPRIKDAVNNLLKNRDGLMAGICNGFQAIIKLGLVPNGEIVDTDENSPTLTFNTIARHQSMIVRTVIASNKSPWLAKTKVGEVYNVPISHGEGRFLCPEETARLLAANGQVATQYADLSGNATMDIAHNPNGSVLAIEGITSPDGRVFGKMGHSERIGNNLYINVDGKYDMQMFEAAVEYYNI